MKTKQWIKVLEERIKVLEERISYLEKRMIYDKLTIPQFPTYGPIPDVTCQKHPEMNQSDLKEIKKFLEDFKRDSL